MPNLLGPWHYPSFKNPEKERNLHFPVLFKQFVSFDFLLQILSFVSLKIEQVYFRHWSMQCMEKVIPPFFVKIVLCGLKCQTVKDFICHKLEMMRQLNVKCHDQFHQV